MKCECDYCIYNEGNACLLTEIEINTLGMCEACILVSFPKDTLAREKEKQRYAFSKE